MPPEAVGQVVQIVASTCRAEPFSRLSGLYADAARLLRFPCLGVGQGKEGQVELPTPGVMLAVHIERSGSKPLRNIAASEAGEAVAELRGQVGLIEVTDPLRITGSIGLVKQLLGPVQCAMRRLVRRH